MRIEIPENLEFVADYFCPVTREWKFVTTLDKNGVVALLTDSDNQVTKVTVPSLFQYGYAYFVTVLEGKFRISTRDFGPEYSM